MAYTLFVVLIVLVSILMVLIVLIQESKGGGLASNFSSTNSIMGVRKTTDIVEKITWGLAALMVVISVACAYVAPQATGENSVMEGATQEQTALPAMPEPKSIDHSSIATSVENTLLKSSNIHLR